MEKITSYFDRAFKELCPAFPESVYGHFPGNVALFARSLQRPEWPQFFHCPTETCCVSFHTGTLLQMHHLHRLCLLLLQVMDQYKKFLPDGK